MEEGILEIKGSGIISLIAYVKTVHGESGFEKWCAALSPEARHVIEGTVLSSSWYGGRHISFGLREKICEVFYNSDPRSARKLGIFVADRGLSGIYKIFVKFGSPEWVTSRAAVVASQFFRPLSLTSVIKKKGHLVMRMTDCTYKSEHFEESFCGFTERALEISGCRNVKAERSFSLTRNDPYTEFESTWDI